MIRIIDGPEGRIFLINGLAASEEILEALAGVVKAHAACVVNGDGAKQQDKVYDSLMITFFGGEWRDTMSSLQALKEAVANSEFSTEGAVQA